ncbi:MAG: hypothetical protein LBH14_08655 [Desulfobulbaceae bacterium]|nr:hypothetical protein [Desulfobulbaceae bacterium]
MTVKERVVTFKAGGRLAEALERLPNKSEFIRRAVELALSGACPLCSGSGHLSSEQQQHLHEFLLNHSLAKCNECHALHFVCQHQDGPAAEEGA